jgi:hypothetical protein
MFSRKSTVAVLLAVGALVSLAGQADARWFTNSLMAWRAYTWRQYVGAEQMGGGQIVGATSFAGGGRQAAAMTAAQWQELVAAQQQQMGVLSAAQWQQQLASQARPSQRSLWRPGQVDPLTAARLRQQQQGTPLGAAWQQLQQQNAPPRPPADDK